MKVVEQFLADGAWRKIDEIVVATGVTRTAMVSSGYLASGEVISHPSQGYKLTRFASQDELARSINNYRSRAQALVDRAHATRDVWSKTHARGGLTP